jgi:hypothetical protein
MANANMMDEREVVFVSEISVERGQYPIAVRVAGQESDGR